MDGTNEIRAYYDNDVEQEWQRLAQHPFEFEINKRFLCRYIRPGQSVLDLGGGPGRYSLFFSERGSQVTLADLSQGNVDYALRKAEELNLPLEGYCLDARDPAPLHGRSFDHILLMGPLYHLTDEDDRIRTMQAALALLKPGGTLSVAFISSYAGIIYAMKYAPTQIDDPKMYRLFSEDKPFSGLSFTESYFIRQGDVLPFMERFPLQKLHYLGSESILAPCEPILLQQEPETIERWLDLAETVCERENLMSYAEHLLYIGRKIE